MVRESQHCEDCEKMEEEYGENNLSDCEYCGHYKTKEGCTCSGAEAQREREHKRIR